MIAKHNFGYNRLDFVTVLESILGSFKKHNWLKPIDQWPIKLFHHYQISVPMLPLISVLISNISKCNKLTDVSICQYWY